jgi:hypothetical protein
MPIVGSSSYSTAELVLNLARSIINDTRDSLAGEILADALPYTFVYLNSAYRYLQDELSANGVRTLEKETILKGITPVATPDPGTQVFIYDQGFNNGTTNFASPALPSDMRMPLRLWERTSGTLSNFIPMESCDDGLPSTTQGGTLRFWEWRTDGIYMVGAMQTIDIRLRYAAYLADLTDGTSTLQLRGAENALAYLTAAEFAAARGSPLADDFRTQAGEFITQIVDYTIRQKQRGRHRRIPWSTSRR